MENEQNVNIDTSNDTQDQVDPTLTADERLAKMQEQNAKLYARAKKAEGFIQDETGKWVKREPKASAPISEERSTKPSDILKADEFKLYRAGYTEEEIDLIMHNGGMKALANDKSPLSLGLKVAREQREAESAASKATDTIGGSEVERKFTVEQMRNMKPDELAKHIGYAN